MVEKLQQKWAAMTPTERKIARRTVDWRHDQSQLTYADMDEAHDTIRDQRGYSINKVQMICLVEESAHDTSAAIKRIHRSIWFSLG